jgi:hypothetical protein
VSDIFREVEEDVRRERYAQLWKRYGDYIIAAIALVILAAAGFQLWRYYEHKARMKASQEYAAAQSLLQANRADQAATAFAKLADSAPGGYAAVARLQNADALMESGNKKEAVALYKRIAAGDDPLLAAVARIREAWAIVDKTPRLQMETLLAPLTDPTSPWRFMAREILAYSDYHAGKMAAAEKQFAGLAKDDKAPIGVRQRANAMASFLKAGGDKNYGSVPPMAKPQPAKPDTAKTSKKESRAKK